MEEIISMLENLRPEFNFRDSKNFIEDGFIDSFDVINIVSDLEDKYGILIDALDIIPENFCSVEAIINVIQKNGGTIKTEELDHD